VNLFAAHKNDTTNPTLGWNAVVPRDQLRMIQIAGTHHSMMQRPNVEVLGQTLSRAVRRVTADSTKLSEQSYSSLFRLQSGRNKTETPIFCVPGAGDNVTSFLELATCLDKPGPIYGLQPRGLDGLLVPHSTVSAASEFYLRAIEEIHPKGPIHLLGHSFGGWVAFDMAQRLFDTGRHVATLVMLDSNAPDNQLSLIREYSRTEAIMKIIDIYEEIVGHPLDLRKSDLDSRNETAQMVLLHNRLVREGLLPRRSEPNILRGPLRTFAMALRTHYKPDTPYQGRVQLVLADDEKLDQDENRRNREQITRGWRRLAPNLTYIHASGNHMTMLKLPHLNDLVRQLRFE
jgi:thioesterase domain-containing protein